MRVEAVAGFDMSAGEKLTRRHWPLAFSLNLEDLKMAFACRDPQFLAVSGDDNAAVVAPTATD